MKVIIRADDYNNSFIFSQKCPLAVALRRDLNLRENTILRVDHMDDHAYDDKFAYITIDGRLTYKFERNKWDFRIYRVRKLDGFDTNLKINYHENSYYRSQA